MSKGPSRRESGYSTGERIALSISSFVLFGFLGGVVRLFSGSVSLGSGETLMAQFAPYVLSSGVAAAVLAFLLPGLAEFVLHFFPSWRGDD